MKLISEQSRHTDRKILKPQVEKRRRERMNRSLDNLKTLLMLQEQSQRRVEKAEILEQTVAFLHNHHKRSFHDGFSSCLQMATRFLGPDRKDVDSSMVARLSQPDSSKDHKSGAFVFGSRQKHPDTRAAASHEASRNDKCPLVMREYLKGFGGVNIRSAV
ncbi:transcription factor HES-7.1-A-like [Synchiropus splendidus]|uniref:transcription factor HES-7.1-A-like n=1 Tax=Synchiropus splendidus TaxID=270530 RepID=UPI00237EC639|nr:transcription factor HES-7.1-A-like [Synchiropus splendidus]